MEDHNIIEFLNFYVSFKNNVIVSYTGPFDKQVLSVLGQNLESVILENPRASKKIFSVFIELAQNICFYSAETNVSRDNEVSGVGTVLVQEYEDHYKFMSGNLVWTDKIAPLVKKCNYINTLDREGLRAFKREQRSLPRSESDGANIGLIQVALTADRPLAVKVIKIDDKSSFFALAVDIDK